ncbi:GGDEF domain-containing protein [Pseudoalteromonas shioyasakiensis]|nr:GGDEF domain-containing protein [Pseudoalteromonas shioyasakiensis]
MIDYQLTFKRAAIYSLVMIATFALLYVFFADVQYSFAYPELLPHVNVINIIIAGLPMVYGMGLIREITISQRIELTEMAARDPLTKLYNRRFAKKLITSAHKKSIEQDSNICIVMADIDKFKNINDNYGHDKGDTILINVAKLISQFINDEDIAVRWGGEEFLLLLTNTDAKQAYAKIETLRIKIAELEAHPDFPDINVTMSFGLIEWQPLASIEKMLQHADEALYRSKHAGRNQTTVAKGECPAFKDADAVN